MPKRKKITFTPLPGELAHHPELGNVRVIERSRSQGIHGATVRPLEGARSEAPGMGMKWIPLRELSPHNAADIVSNARGGGNRVPTFDIVNTVNTELSREYDFGIHRHGCADVARQRQRYRVDVYQHYERTAEEAMQAEIEDLEASGIEGAANFGFRIFPCCHPDSQSLQGERNSLQSRTASATVDAAGTNQPTSPTRRTSMATATKTRSRGRKAAEAEAEETTTKAKGRGRGKAAAKAAEPEPSGNGNGRARRTHEDILALVPEIVKHLQNGVTMTEIRLGGDTVGEGYGAGPQIRRALAERGYNTKGEKVTSETIEGKGATLAKRVAAKRREGWAWYRLELATDMSQEELKELLEENGFGDLAKGRVAQERDEEEAAPKARRGRGKAASSDDEDEAPARKRGRRRGRGNPSTED